MIVSCLAFGEPPEKKKRAPDFRQSSIKADVVVAVDEEESGAEGKAGTVDGVHQSVTLGYLPNSGVHSLAHLLLIHSKALAKEAAPIRGCWT